MEWFWGQYNLCLCKALPLAEKASQVALKKELAEERARYQVACEAREAAWEKEKLELRRLLLVSCVGNSLKRKGDAVQ